MDAVRIDGLSLELNGKRLLDGIDLSVAKGQFVAIAGPNGAGKSTLLKCMDMLQDNWSGSVHIMEHDIRKLSRRALARIVSYVPQQFGLLPRYTVREFVKLSRYAWSDGDDAPVEEALDTVGMRSFEGRYLDSLSGGELQKAFIASALAQKAEIILLDEPTAFLDLKYQQQIWGMLRELKASLGLTILAVTHDINAASANADSICALRNGKVFGIFDPKDFMHAEILNSLFDAKFEVLDSDVAPGKAWLV